VIDLNQMVECFIDEAARFYGNTYRQYDAPTIDALKNQNQEVIARQRQVRAFLRGYSVLQGLTADDETAVVHEIIEFADAQDLAISPTSNNEILERFDDLHRRCRTNVHPRKDGTFRDLTSLASKALWCCYPDAIPMFDSRAASALCVVSHLAGLAGPQREAESRYELFLSKWLDLYSRVKPTIDAIGDNRLCGCTHKVRVLDMILWTIGGPDSREVLCAEA
jgi:hypothetical protein